MKIKLDHAGIGAMLRSPEVAAAIGAQTSAVRGNVTLPAHHADRMPVKTESYTTDRAAGAVTIAHAGGLGVEAKYGVLVRAASAAGLEVRAR